MNANDNNTKAIAGSLALQSLVHAAVLAATTGIVVVLNSAAMLTAASTLVVIACAAGAFIGGLVLSHIVHEWGHYAGARISGSQLLIKPRISALFFDFDYGKNNPRQYLYLSVGGLLGNIALLLGLLLWVPMTTWPAIALLAAVLGQLVYVLILELPISLGIMAGRDPLKVLTEHFGQGRPLFTRAGVGGVLTAAVVFAVY